MAPLPGRAAARRPAIPPPPTRATACADEIRRRILDGHYAGGLQLRQDALAEELGVSRIPVREALVQLEAEGLVKIHPHRGAIVTEVSPADIQELFEFRALVEPRLLQKSAPLLSSVDYDLFGEILEEYSEELRRLNIDRWGDLNTRFHSLLYSRAESPRMLAAAHQLLQNADRFTRMQIYYTDGRERAEREHLQIVDLCREGKVEAASGTLRQAHHPRGQDLVAHIATHKRAHA